MKTEPKISIPEFFKGRNVLITGATGFMGKVLVEKLLRCCPEIGRIYIILRSRGDKSPKERWDEITELPVFDRLKTEYPKNLEKIYVMEGDVAEKNLGLAVHHQIMLEEDVSVVFHSAASVRFDDPLSKAIFLNTRGALESIKLAGRMRNLQCYVYVSTAYCNSHLDVPEIEEKVYPAEYDYNMLIKLLESHAKPEEIDVLAKKIIEKHPNTYTFSKSLAEQVMADYSTKIPIVIVRPSIVIHSIYEPFTGWLDNLNGPFSIIAGVNKGIMRVFLCDENCSLDCVGVDCAINSLIVSAWHKAIAEEREKKQLNIYNCVCDNVRTLTIGDIINSAPSAYDNPYTDVLWYPSLVTTTNKTLFTFLFYILQIIPSLFLDAVLWLFSYKPMFLKLNRKIYISCFALHTFTTKVIRFSNRCYQSLWTAVSEADRKIFFMNLPEEITVSDILLLGHLGMRKYYFHESESNLPQARVKFNRLYWADRTLRVFVLGIFAWFSSKYVINTLYRFVS
ncbi:hypothetical protein LSTR_LSTR003493 [Laodelphax striatellus]|uniref:Fatty acyl-CoA reductase n=1 Tax=Laodelphax striatellus TaxID=195883 RepID=A0A482WYL0_LAOST|nr:hypothetical protein LSTR_LSTR003493 [Laodelphax striatellus]